MKLYVICHKGKILGYKKTYEEACEFLLPILMEEGCFWDVQQLDLIYNAYKDNKKFFDDDGNRSIWCFSGVEYSIEEVEELLN